MNWLGLRNLSIFSKLLISHIFVGLLAVIVMVAAFFIPQARKMESEFQNIIKRKLDNVVYYYKNGYWKEIKHELGLLTDSQEIYQMLQAREEEKDFVRPNLENLFLHFSKGEENVFKSLKFVDYRGNIQTVIRDGKRDRKLSSIFNGGDQDLDRKLKEMFFALRKVKTSHRLFCTSPIKDGDSLVMLVGMARMDPDTGRFGGAVFAECDLKVFLDYAAAQIVLGHKVISITGSENKTGSYMINDVHDPANSYVFEQGIGKKFSLDDHCLFNIKSSLPKEIFYGQKDRLILNGILIVFLLSLGIVLLAYFVSKTLSNPIAKVSSSLSALSDGELMPEFEIRSENEIGKMQQAFNKLVKNSKELISQAENVAKGNYTVSIIPRSANDSLSKALIEMTDALRNFYEESEINQQELEDKARDLELTNQYKSEFLANMSHELRTPMNAVLGMGELLTQTKLDEEQQEYANTILSSGENLLSVINDILDFSKIESGKLELEEEPFQILSTIEEAMDILRPKADEKKIELLVLVEPDVPPYILGDVTRLRQIIINLISNAVKFTSEGEIFINVIKEYDKDGQVELRFSVKDTGIGIKKEQQIKLFKAFSQVDSSTTRKYGGTGLGLAICKRLVDLMNGRIWVESQPDKGSTFYFTLNAPIASDVLIETHFNALLPALEGVEVLIVDDNATNRKILKMQCEKWGMKTNLAENGQETLALLKSKKKLDIGILDMQMPEMDGLQLAGEIRKLKGPEQLPLILLSSIQKPEGIDFTGKVFSMYLTKPVKEAQLFDAFRKTFAKWENYKSKQKTLCQQTEQPSITSPLQLGILLAEDNKVNCILAKKIFAKLGHELDIAYNGKEAIAAYNKKTYDLIFMDCQMPEMNGYDATRELRKIGATLPIIAVTAHAMKGDKEKCLDAGMDDYVAKPFKQKDLIDIINKYVKTFESEEG